MIWLCIWFYFVKIVPSIVSHTRRLFSLNSRMPLWDTQAAISIDCLTLDSVHLTLKFGAHWFRTWFYDCWYFELQRKLATDTLYHAKLRAFFFSFEKRNEIFEWAVCVLHYESCGCTVYQSRSVCSMHECVQFEVKCMKRKKDGQSYRVETYTTNKSKFNSKFSIAKLQLPLYVHWTERGFCQV